MGYDVVLMNLRMSEMDGYEATHRIGDLQDSYFLRLPIVALMYQPRSNGAGR